MGNSGCCARAEWCLYKGGAEERIILNDIQIIENYPTRLICRIQTIFRGFLFRRRFRNEEAGLYALSNFKTKDKEREIADKVKGNKAGVDKTDNMSEEKTYKKSKFKKKKTLTPNGFLKELMPGKILTDEEVEKIQINDDIASTEKLLGQFIIEEKEILRFLEDYKCRLKKYQLAYEDGQIYIGYLDPDWEREGYGILITQDGSKYEGTFRENKMWGRGRLINPRGEYYEGDFENDKASGFGKYVNKDGCIYIGDWKNHKQHGKGEELFSDGSRYEGLYENGLKHGKGKFCWPDGSSYEGDFINNLFQGFGVYRWRDGRLYQGEWKNNKMEGVGIFIWPDKKKYIGQYLNDKKSGYGIFIWPGGKKYEGQWMNGMQHGYGIITISRHQKFGVWKEGQKDRWVPNGEGLNHFKQISLEIKNLIENFNFCNVFLKSEDNSPISSSNTSSKIYDHI